MANPIRRIVQIVMDRAAAAKAEADGKRALGGIEGAVDKTTTAVKRLGLALGAALTGAKLIGFLRDSVREAAEAERVWAGLASTITAAGLSFQQVEGQLRGLASGFQAATLFTDDDFAATLSSLTAQTGDFSASLNNMGLVANVAARFFDGQLGPAVDLVAKVMGGQTTQLQRMGIAVSSAQEGLDVLAQRSMGAASDATSTLSGRVIQLTNDYGDFKEAIGNTVIDLGESGDQMGRVAAFVRGLTADVEAGKSGLQSFVSTGLEILIQTLDALLRVATGVAQFFAGAFLSVMGTAARVLVFFTQGITLASTGLSKFGRLVGLDTIAESVEGFTAKVDALRQSLDDLGKTAIEAGTGLGRDGLGQFTRTLIPTVAPPRQRIAEAPPLPSRNQGRGVEATSGNPPAVKQAVDAVAAAIAEFGRAESEADALSDLLQDDFDRVAARVNNLRAVINALTQAGVDPGNEALRGYAHQLQMILPRTDLVAEAQSRLDERLRVSATLAALIGDEYDRSGDMISALSAAMVELAEIGTPQAEAALEGIARQLRGVRSAARETQKGFDTAAAAGEAFGEVVGAALGVGIGPMAAAKAKENLILAAEATAKGIALSLNPFTAGKAGQMFALAARHTAIAASWGALSASFGGGGNSGAGGVSAAQSASGNAAQTAAAPKQDVTIVFEGAGFDALNPIVQDVVLGAIETGRERVGPNANVNVIRRR